jgi:hypothetical protein
MIEEFALGHIFFWVLRVSPVRIIPPMLHSFIYHQRYIILKFGTVFQKTRLKGTGDSYPRNKELIQIPRHKPHTYHSRLQQARYKHQPILCLASISRLHVL